MAWTVHAIATRKLHDTDMTGHTTFLAETKLAHDKPRADGNFLMLRLLQTVTKR